MSRNDKRYSIGQVESALDGWLDRNTRTDLRNEVPHLRADPSTGRMEPITGTPTESREYVEATKAGMPMPELKQRLGHAHLSTTMRYAKYAPKRRDAYRDALDRMGLGTTEIITLPVLQQAAGKEPE